MSSPSVTLMVSVVPSRHNGQGHYVAHIERFLDLVQSVERQGFGTLAAVMISPYLSPAVSAEIPLTTFTTPMPAVTL